MEYIQWIAVGLFSISLIVFLSAIMALIVFFFLKSDFNKLNKKKVKGKSKKREKERELQRIKKNKKKSLLFLIILLIIGFASSGGYFYTSYFQSINLTKEDSDAIVKGYYLIEDFEDLLKKIKEGDVEEKVANDKIRVLAGQMSSYAAINASQLNKKEGQLMLNRLYNIIREIGINASSQSNEFFENQELIDEFLEDIEKAKQYEQETFKYYKVNEKNLKEKA